MSDANVAQWPESIKNIMKRFGKPAFVIPGHQSWASNESLAHTLKLLHEYENKK